MLPGFINFGFLGFNLEPSFSDSLFAATSLLVTVFLVDKFAQLRQEAREREQFREVRKIAYRSLSQSVNDVGRRLIGPLVGANLFLAGIPRVTPNDVERYQEVLQATGLERIEPKSGFWNAITEQEILSRFSQLSDDHDWLDLFFRFTTASRRDLQDGFSSWATVMNLDPEAREKLDEGWKLFDSTVLLSEAIRALRVSNADDRGQVKQNAEFQLVRTIGFYRKWLALLQEHAQLPTKGQFTQTEDWSVRESSEN